MLFSFPVFTMFCLVWHCLRYDLTYVLQLLSCGIGEYPNAAYACEYATMAIPLDPEDEGTRFLLNIWNYSSSATAPRASCIFNDRIFCTVLLSG